MIPDPTEDDLKIDLDAEYQLADRDSMRRAIIRVAAAKPKDPPSGLAERCLAALCTQAQRDNVDGNWMSALIQWLETMERIQALKA